MDLIWLLLPNGYDACFWILLDTVAYKTLAVLSRYNGLFLMDGQNLSIAQWDDTCGQKMKQQHEIE